MSSKPKSDAAKSAEKEALDRKLEEALEETFPASDPVAILEPMPDHPPAKKR
jgi:hypothetical protein